MQIAVVGGGVVGLAIASALSRPRVEVTCFERDELGSGSTSRAAGICYDAFADDVDAAVADHALSRYREWGLLDACPYVWVARTDSDATAISSQIDQMRANGRAVDAIDPVTLGERYPDLKTESIKAAGIAHDAGLVDPPAVVDYLADRARTNGVTIETGTRVTLAEQATITTPSGTEQFDAVVVAAGPATKALVAETGVSLALKTYRAQALRTEPLDTTLPAFYDATETFYWRPRGNGLLIGDGAHEVDPSEWRTEADPAFVKSALERVRDATALGPVCERAWAGLCTATPDRDPLVGQVADGLWVATGWHGHGLMRAPAIGDYLAARLCDDPSPFDVPFSERVDPTRFDGSETFDALGDPTAGWKT